MTTKKSWQRAWGEDMKVFIDTNVVVDALTKREPFYEDSLLVIKSCDIGENEGILAAHSLTSPPLSSSKAASTKSQT